MKVYLAATFRRADEMLGVKDVLEALGHHVTSTWIHNGQLGEGISKEVINSASMQDSWKHARRDLSDIEKADAIAVFTDMPSSTGGYMVELGYALALDKKIFIIGPYLNIFMTLPHVVHYSGWARFFMAMYQQHLGASNV